MLFPMQFLVGFLVHGRYPNLRRTTNLNYTWRGLTIDFQVWQPRYHRYTQSCFKLFPNYFILCCYVKYHQMYNYYWITFHNKPDSCYNGVVIILSNNRSWWAFTLLPDHVPMSSPLKIIVIVTVILLLPQNDSTIWLYASYIKLLNGTFDIFSYTYICMYIYSNFKLPSSILSMNCMVTRAIHLEKLNSLETDSFLNGFRRFIARRGMPETIFCDNGTSFVGGENELKRAMQELQSDKVQHFTAKNGIDWHFIPPCAPHRVGLGNA